MTNGDRIQVNRETFQSQDTDGKLDLLRDMQEDQNQQISRLWQEFQNFNSACSTRAVECEQHFEKKGSNRWANVYAIIGGFGGGVAFWAAMMAFSVNIT